MTYLWCVCVIVVYNYGSVQSEVADCNTNCANLKGLKDGLVKMKAYIAEAEKTCTPKAAGMYKKLEESKDTPKKIECANRGGYLVEVDNDLEDSWLVSMLKGEVWIGFTDSHSEGRWRWEIGASITYTHWQSGKPNGGGGENCANYCEKKCHKSYCGWNDRPCTVPTGYVCEKNIDD
ncbi:perlucin-like protein [Mytilus edulis]|uniref:perlucin-like protein n=1 Tax=Mytilus edulis TaxID=6550 RepID=UPI0039EFFCDD